MRAEVVLGWILVAAGCASDQQLQPTRAEAKPAQEPEVVPYCPSWSGGGPGYTDTSAIVQIHAHCSGDAPLNFGIDAIDVDVTQLHAVAYLVDTLDPDDPGEGWPLVASSMSVPPREEWGGRCTDARYWLRTVPADVPDLAYDPQMAPSVYTCDDVTVQGRLTYAFALFNRHDELIDCAIAGFDPLGLQALPAEVGPGFPLDTCHWAPFGFQHLRD